MRQYLFFILFVGGSLSVSGQLNSWQAFVDSIPTLSSPRACDLNNDGILDVIIGGGTDGVASNHGIMAFNGVDGSILWNRASRNEVFGSAIFQDITNDGIKDVFITGRQAQLLAINGANGQLLWDYFPYGINPADSGLYNFYNPQFISDVNNDGFKEILVANGGDHAAPDWETDRPPAHIMVISSLTGSLIAKAVVPDSAETYCSPLVADIQGNGIPWVLFGTGGENLGGAFWACPLNNLIQFNSLANSIQLDSDPNKGFIAPAALAQNGTIGFDIIIQGFNGKITKIKGASLGLSWQFQLPSTESSAEPVLGNFVGGDNIPDVLAILFKGIAPSYSDFYQVMIDGRTGQLSFKDSIGTINYASANALDFNNDGRDEGLISVTYSENGSFKHRLQKIDFTTNTITQIGTTKGGVNLGSTPLITDLDNDNQLDLIYVVKKDSLNPIAWKGIYVNREELSVTTPNSGIAWGSYLGTINDGEYTYNAVDCGIGSVIAGGNIIQPSCNGSANGSIDPILVSGNGPYTYLWDNGSTDSILSNLTQGAYWVRITDAFGCYEERTLTLNDPYVISFGGIMAPVCLGGSNGKATVGSSGCPCQFSGCTFLWDNGITTKPNNSLTSGWHEVTIHHPSGCVVVDSVFVPEPLPIIVDSTVFNNTCFGNSTGSIELISSGLYEPTHYLWSTNDTTALNNNLPAGNYTVSVSDGRGCVDTLNFEINEPSEVILSYSSANVSCFEGANGTINMQATGGYENYSFWVNGTQSSSSVVGLFAGSYTVSVSDSAQCYSTSSNLVITQPNAITLIMNSTPEIDGLDGTASVIIQGGIASYSILWNDPNSQSDSLAVYLNEGWYTAAITDANGCLHSDSVYVGSFVGIVDESTQSISVFPNPAKDFITINGITGKEIKVFDANGKLIKKLPFSHSLSTAELTSGIYYLEIDLEKTVARLKFYKIN
jgi:hypothetical protein